MAKGDNSVSMPSLVLLQEALELMFKTFPNQSFTNLKIEEFIIQKLRISREVQEIPREKSRTELQYRLAWARTKSKSAGLIVRDGTKSWKSVP